MEDVQVFANTYQTHRGLRPQGFAVPVSRLHHEVLENRRDANLFLAYFVTLFIVEQAEDVLRAGRRCGGVTACRCRGWRRSATRQRRTIRRILCVVGADLAVGYVSGDLQGSCGLDCCARKGRVGAGVGPADGFQESGA